ncbi:MAG: AAA family ATPase [Blastocatellia bacterium]|nr:AAA family ATPase [Blastocatellia bacterium]
MTWIFPFAPLPPAYRIDWPALEAAFDWLRAMQDCPQNPVFHGEGDVLTHTKMVCEALAADPLWQALETEDQSVLFAAALLHDVAKPIVTKIDETGAITARGQGRKGMTLARNILWHDETGLIPPVPFHLREMIVALVRQSSLPFHLLSNDHPRREVIKASQTVRCDWLEMLERADAQGRVCADQAELLEKVALFGEYCREQECYDRPFRFPSDYSRFIYFSKENADPLYHAFETRDFEVVLLCGLAGAGKDTLIARKYPDWPVISLDALRFEMEVDPTDNQGAIITAAKEQARAYLRVHQKFVWNATNVTRQLRSQLIGLFSGYGANVTIVYVEAPFTEILSRNRTRSKVVPERIIHKMAAKLEIPDATEADRVLYFCDGTEVFRFPEHQFEAGVFFA